MQHVLNDGSMYFSYEDDKEAVKIFFDEATKGILTVTKVETNPLYRGRGLAAEAMQIFFDELKSQNKKMKPVCPYAKYWADNNVEDKTYLI